MTKTQIKQIIRLDGKGDATHITFDYNGKACGIDPFSQDHFEMWCGENFVVANSIEEVFEMAIFDGKTILDISNEIIAD